MYSKFEFGIQVFSQYLNYLHVHLLWLQIYCKGPSGLSPSHASVCRVSSKTFVHLVGGGEFGIKLLSGEFIGFQISSVIFHEFHDWSCT
jgi:hypothetical protein